MNNVSVKQITEDSIVFSDGTTLQHYHQDDCCENHYLDFSALDIKDFEGLEFNLSNDKFFKRIENYGIELIPIKGWPVRIAGYGHNNGYYSSNMSLIIRGENKKTIKHFDISECQKINWY